MAPLLSLTARMNSRPLISALSTTGRSDAIMRGRSRLRSATSRESSWSCFHCSGSPRTTTVWRTDAMTPWLTLTLAAASAAAGVAESADA